MIQEQQARQHRHHDEGIGAGHLLPALDEAVVTGLEATYHAAQKPPAPKVAVLKG